MNEWREVKAVFFDVDGTLIPGASLEMRFVRAQWARGPFQLCAMAGFGLARVFQYFFREDRGRSNKSYLRGCRLEELSSSAASYVREQGRSICWPPLLERVRAHADAGARLFLLTGTLDCLAKPLAEELGIEDWMATELDVEDGICTGRLRGIHPYGTGKKELFEQTCERLELRPEACAAYADRFSDVALLEATGCPVAVQPDRQLRAYAIQNGWEIMDGAGEAVC